MFVVADPNNSGTVSYEEFKKFIQSDYPKV